MPFLKFFPTPLLSVLMTTSVTITLVDYNDRYDFYHLKEERLSFGLEYLDKITGGGIPDKTLNIIMAYTGVGKSLFMCDIASKALLQGKNVLYITCEMIEERIAERIDANLFDIPHSRYS